MSAPLSLFGKLRKYFMWRPDADMPDQSGKVCIVTGANSGVGYQIMRWMAIKNATVIAATHNLPGMRKAIRDVKREHPRVKIIPMFLDASSLTSVKTFVDEFKARGLPLHVLFNVAGEAMGPPGPGGDGKLPNHTIAVNYWGPFLLMNMLMSQLKDFAPHARIVNVCSLLGEYLGGVDWDDLLGERLTAKGNPLDSYNMSKKMLSMATRDMARRALPDGVDVFATHPGFSGTPLWHKSEQHHPSARIFMWAEEWFAQHPFYGAIPMLYAATEPSLQGKGGLYIGTNRINAFPTHIGDYWGTEARSPEACTRLYDASLKWVATAVSP